MGRIEQPRPLKFSTKVTAYAWASIAADNGHEGVFTDTLFPADPFEELANVCKNSYSQYASKLRPSENVGLESKSLIEFLEKKMTPEQITKAEELVKEMVKKNPKLLKQLPLPPLLPQKHLHPCRRGVGWWA